MWSSFQRTRRFVDRLDGTQHRQFEEEPRQAVQVERQAVQAALSSELRWIRSIALSFQVQQPARHVDHHQDNQGIHFRRLHSNRIGQHKQLQK